ncbi:MAG: DUF503 domain-containing protein [Epsilonproteobacteria bacterium]|nr:DUF503 domain-containing protein [Campylobacterota bacterium]NPA65037.1 DUF503 domain-containing protein [Campylobacterota bacterium]
MLLVHALITVDLPYIHSLKGRRKVLASIKDRLKGKNMAVADLSGEYAKEAVLAVAFFALGHNDANNKIASLRRFLEESLPEASLTIDYEIL